MRLRVGNLMIQATAERPMNGTLPRVCSFALDRADNIVLCTTTMGEPDSRGGIFVFNSAGIFQHRIAVEQK